MGSEVRTLANPPDPSLPENPKTPKMVKIIIVCQKMTQKKRGWSHDRTPLETLFPDPRRTPFPDPTREPLGFNLEYQRGRYALDLPPTGPPPGDLNRVWRISQGSYPDHQTTKREASEFSLVQRINI